MASEIITTTDGPVGSVRINRPEALNALNAATLQKLTLALRRFDEDPQIRCLLLTGSGRAFATGLEVTELVGATLVEVREHNPLAALDELEQIRKPLVAAVSGYALGLGCELVLSCDIVVAAETARFGFTEVNLGIIPGGGGTQRLTRVVGKARAMDLILTGRTLTAREAWQMGLVSRLVPRENCEEEALAICHELGRRPPLAVQAAKQAIHQAAETTMRDGLALERTLFTLLFGTDDQKEGLRAYLEKRPPIFAGR